MLFGGLIFVIALAGIFDPQGPLERIWPLGLMAGLFLNGYGILLHRDSWRCFNKMIEAYNNSLGATSRQKEE